MTAPTTTGIAVGRTPRASIASPAHAATTTLLTTATIPATVSINCHVLGESPFKRRG